MKDRIKISAIDSGGRTMSRMKDLQKQVIKVLNDTEERAGSGTGGDDRVAA